jgi:hypothetical protein
MVSSLVKVGVVHVSFVFCGRHQQPFVPCRVQTMDQGIVKQSGVALALMAALNPLAIKDSHPVLYEEGDQSVLGRGVIYVSNHMASVIFQMNPVDKRAEVLRNPDATGLENVRPGAGYICHTGTGLFCTCLLR